MTKYLGQQDDYEGKHNRIYRLANTVLDDDASELLGGAWADIVKHVWTVAIIVLLLTSYLYFYEHSKWGQQRKIRKMHEHKHVGEPIMKAPDIEVKESS